ncbi:hypothetical protein PVAP13_4NG051900 [Panicum virgatum]|uniref:Uncharacterized protein n=1 Tax=Panicum virgatum TaxID=38727 RepID=A0A8T0SZF0_PANVG|nr:hypothetical protein PVAP13_4NG051900 [Panicum virgatum]
MSCRSSFLAEISRRVAPFAARISGMCLVRNSSSVSATAALDGCRRHRSRACPVDLRLLLSATAALDGCRRHRSRACPVDLRLLLYFLTHLYPPILECFRICFGLCLL